MSPRSLAARILFAFTTLGAAATPAFASSPDPLAASRRPGPGSGPSAPSSPSLDLRTLGAPSSLLILGVAATAAAWTWEETDEQQTQIRSRLDGSALDPAIDLGNLYGSGWVLGLGSASLSATGRVTGREGVTALGDDLLRSFTWSAAATGSLKYGIDRRRPSGGRLSFPSGHTTSAFSAVPVLWHHGGWKAGVPAAALASFTALGRIEENRHFVSDVIAGAAVGLLVGRSVAAQRARRERAARWILEADRVGVGWEF